MKVIIDTNFLLIPYLYKVDIFEEVSSLVHDNTLCIMEGTEAELLSIAEHQAGKDKRAALFAIRYLDRFHKIPASQGKTVDEAILSLAKKEGIIVATQDQDLKRALHKIGRKLIVLRQKNHLELF